MNKIFILTFVICLSIISCGKKGDPVYQDPELKTSKQNTFLNKA
jgi:hypothetical protein